ncbi:MAG: hypothetical protein B7Y88_16050 [Sphingomonadales bacterium 32-64-17]|nr:MAG: hypothetical protein B7Y88_16050 [Sphingomonadales bacterium 32-64-17]
MENALEGAKVWFNRNFDRMVGRYLKAVEAVVDRKWRFLGLYGLILAILAGLFLHLPGGFLPNEDQGRIMVQFRLPPGATQVRTIELRDQVEKYLAEHESANVETMFLVAGGGGGGQNSGQGFINLKHWDERPGPENTADAIAQRATMAFSGLRDGQVFFMVPGSVRGLGDSAGFNMNLQNVTGMSREQFVAARDKLVETASASPLLAQVRSSELPDNATLKIDLDTQRLTAYGLNSSDVNTTLSTAWGGRYVNDFIENGRVKRVYVQGEPEFRATPEDLSQWYVRASDGSMAPFSAFSTIGWATTPNSTSRFQGVSYEERQSSGQAPLLYALSVLVVFLCLAALYESWSIPVAVLLVIPLGLVGALFAATLRGLENDVFLQIGLLTTMGLASKNAILMIEFAEQEEKKGKRIIEAVLAAARIRLRPILMTSFAFIFGVLPLAISTGAGANSRIAIGTSVIGGMLTASVLAIFYIPLLFVLVRRSTRDGLKKLHQRFGRRHGQGEAQA